MFAESNEHTLPKASNHDPCGLTTLMGADIATRHMLVSTADKIIQRTGKACNVGGGGVRRGFKFRAAKRFRSLPSYQVLMVLANLNSCKSLVDSQDKLQSIHKTKTSRGQHSNTSLKNRPNRGHRKGPRSKGSSSRPSSHSNQSRLDGTIAKLLDVPC